jgi:hypothetical protein
MLQPSHRGIYEFLWSEHKYPVMAVSLKSFQGMASRLGKRPQILALLRKMTEYAFSERNENYNALLNAYTHIKPLISRERRRDIIETLLIDETAATRMIYEDVVAHAETGLAGCRLFFPAEHAIYKLWDSQDRPGLWICFGPFQLHLTPQQVFDRVCLNAHCEPQETLDRLCVLAKGITAEMFAEWPEKLRLTLAHNNMIAMAEKKIWLHPRIKPATLSPQIERYNCDFLSAAALTIEKIWDNSDYPPEKIAQLPDYDEFCELYKAEAQPSVAWQQNFDCVEAYEFIGDLFWRQWCKDNGQAAGIPEIANETESGSVGMETADEEIHSEEGEHGDDETCD